MNANHPLERHELKKKLYNEHINGGMKVRSSYSRFVKLNKVNSFTPNISFSTSPYHLLNNSSDVGLENLVNWIN